MGTTIRAEFQFELELELERAADARSAIVCAVLFWVNGDDLLPYSNAASCHSARFLHSSGPSHAQSHILQLVIKLLEGTYE